MNIINRSLPEKANQITLSLLSYGHARISPAWYGSSVNRSFSYLYYVREGRSLIKSGSKTLELSAGNWYLIPSGYNFEYSCDEYMEHVYFHIMLLRADMLDMLRHIKEPLVLRDESPEILFELAKRDDLLSVLTVKEKIYGTVLRILKENNISPEEQQLSECVRNAIKYIRANLSISLTSTDIAEHSFVSRSKLTKCFRAELSMSIQDYLSDIVLTEASGLIVNTSLSLGEISEQLGFFDQFYFSRRFKQKYGLSPREYRQRSREVM